MIWPFRRRHPNRYSVATEVVTFGQRLCDLIVTAGPARPFAPRWPRAPLRAPRPPSRPTQGVRGPVAAVDANRASPIFHTRKSPHRRSGCDHKDMIY